MGVAVGVSTGAAGADWGYAVVISSRAWSDPGWRQVAETLRNEHQGEVVRYDGAVAEALPRLKQLFPRYACFVAPPEEATRAFVAQVHVLTRSLDDDPYSDCLWAILTGYDAKNALRIAQQRQPLVIRKAASGTEIPLDRFEQGVWFSELKAGQVVRKAKSGTAVEDSGPSDSTEAVVKSLTEYQPDLFVTSGHATERDWQMGYTYKNGYFRCEAGTLYGFDTNKRKLPVVSPNPKVYLPVGNCLMGHIDGTNAMALAFLNSGGVNQMIGYTVTTWYGYAGWGCLDYFVEQPGRYDLAEAFFANDTALIRRLQEYFPDLVGAKIDPDKPARPNVEVGEAARAAGLKAQDGFGLLYDRDVLALYGDPAWDARLAPAPLAWEQTLSEKEGLWTFEIKPRAGEKSFSSVNGNGSQRGGRPIIGFFPRRLKDVEVVAGKELKPVIADNFILVPNPGACDPAKDYRVVFRSR